MRSRRLVFLRVLSQSVFLLFFVYVLWSTTYPLTGGVSPNVLFWADPLLVLLTGAHHIPRALGVSAAFLALTLLLGRFFCGWVCPLGSSSDLAARLAGRAGPGGRPFRRARRIKYILLGALVILAAAGLQLAWVFDPVVISARFVSLNLIPAVVKSADAALVWLIRILGFYGPLYDFYRVLKEGPLGVNARFFGHTLIVLAVFLGILAAGLFYRRVWCRTLCPLGALYALLARFARLRRVTPGCVECGRCAAECRMAAIREDGSYDAGECILCMDCVYDCTTGGTAFSFRPPRTAEPAGTAPAEPTAQGLTRGQFLGLVAVSAPALARAAGESSLTVRKPGAGLLRPPGALPEAEFVDRCVRCGNCMKVCLTNGLQPVLFEAGARGMWTPRLVPVIGNCSYNCNQCGQVCPVSAIEPLPIERKREFRIGLARVDGEICIPWSRGRECLVCEEHCPVPDKAIKRERVPGRRDGLCGPRVEESLCIGCGLCENKCPLRPERAIKVGRSDRGPGLS